MPPVFKRIKDLTEKVTVDDNDWFVLEDSDDSFKTKKVKGQYIGSNIFKSDGALTGNRTLDGDGNSLTFSNISLFGIDADVKMTGSVAVNNDIASNIRHYVYENTGKSFAFKSEATGSTWASFNSAISGTANWNDSVDGRASYNTSVNDSAVEGISTNGNGGKFQSGTNYAIRMNGNFGLEHILSGNALHRGMAIYKVGGSVGVFEVVSDAMIKMEELSQSTSYTDDASASAGGVQLGELYRNGSVIQIRVS